MARKRSNGKEDDLDVKPTEAKPTTRTRKRPEAKPKDVTVSVRSGGAVGMVGFGNLKSDFTIFESRSYDVTGFTDDEVTEFYDEQYIKMREHADGLAQIEFDSLIDQSALFDADGNYIGSK